MEDYHTCSGIFNEPVNTGMDNAGKFEKWHYFCSDMKTSIDVCRQTSKFYAQANTLLRNFRYCSDDV